MAMDISSRVRTAAAALVCLAAVCGTTQGSEMGVAVGDSAPTFELTAASGGSVSLSDYSGQTLAIVFYRTGT